MHEEMMLGFNFEPYLIAICSGFLFLVIFLIYQTSKRKVVPDYLASQVGETQDQNNKEDETDFGEPEELTKHEGGHGEQQGHVGQQGHDGRQGYDGQQGHADNKEDSKEGEELDFADLASTVVVELCDKNKWQELARELGFRRPFIQDTKRNNSEGDSHCFAAVFVAWKKRARPKFTRASLINALRSINESDLAETLAGEQKPPNPLAKHLDPKDLQHPIKWQRPGDPPGATPRSTDIIKHPSQRKLWRELGYNFRVDVDGIQIDNYPNEEKCSRSVFDQWIKGQTARGKKDDRPRVWATVISALKESGGTDLATELKIALNNQVEE